MNAFGPSARSLLHTMIPRALPWAMRRLPLQGVAISKVCGGASIFKALAFYSLRFVEPITV